MNRIWGNGEMKQEEEKDVSDDLQIERMSICEVIANRIYFYSDIRSITILRLTRELRNLSNDLISRGIRENIKDQNIFLNIHSYGGSIFAGLSGMDEVLNCQIPVITVVDGCCASAATFLSVVGKKRFIHKHAYMLIHQLSSFFWGKYSEFQDEKINLDKIMEMIKNIYAEYTKVPEAKLDEILKHDIWFSAQECLDYGLVDKIV